MKKLGIPWTWVIIAVILLCLLAVLAMTSERENHEHSPGCCQSLPGPMRQAVSGTTSARYVLGESDWLRVGPWKGMKS